jgi:enoyl-[acyl-carrier protein] reductase II
LKNTKTKLGRRVAELIGLDYPVFQGGMAWLGTAELVAAVSAAGGLGAIGAGSMPASWVGEQVAKVRAATGRPFGVNVQMGTRFVRGTECIAHPAYKQAILGAGDRSTAVTGQSTGHPVRAIRNPFTREFERLEAAGTPKSELERIGAGRFRAAAIEGDVGHGTVIAGQISGLVQSVEPAAAIIQRTIREAEIILSRLGRETQ